MCNHYLPAKLKAFAFFIHRKGFSPINIIYYRPKEVELNMNPEKYFYVCDGTVLKSLKDLKKAVKEMPDGVYAYHLERDDFSKWVGGVIKNAALAKKLSGAERQKAMKVLSAAKSKAAPALKTAPKAKKTSPAKPKKPALKKPTKPAKPKKAIKKPAAKPKKAAVKKTAKVSAKKPQAKKQKRK
jgi:hypothetical protein